MPAGVLESSVCVGPWQECVPWVPMPQPKHCMSPALPTIGLFPTLLSSPCPPPGHARPQVLDVLMNGSMNTTILGPATRVEVLKRVSAENEEKEVRVVGRRSAQDVDKRMPCKL